MKYCLKEPLAINIGERFFYVLKRLSYSLLVFSSFVCLFQPPTVDAAIIERFVQKRVEGTVNYVRSNYIAILYSVDRLEGTEYEIGFPIDSSTKLVNRREWQDIHEGDEVVAVFEDLIVGKNIRGK